MLVEPTDPGKRLIGCVFDNFIDDSASFSSLSGRGEHARVPKAEQRAFGGCIKPLTEGRRRQVELPLHQVAESDNCMGKGGERVNLEQPRCRRLCYLVLPSLGRTERQPHYGLSVIWIFRYRPR